MKEQTKGVENSLKMPEALKRLWADELGGK